MRERTTYVLKVKGLYVVDSVFNEVKFSTDLKDAWKVSMYSKFEPSYMPLKTIEKLTKMGFEVDLVKVKEITTIDEEYISFSLEKSLEKYKVSADDSNGISASSISGGLMIMDSKGLKLSNAEKSDEE